MRSGVLPLKGERLALDMKKWLFFVFCGCLALMVSGCTTLNAGRTSSLEERSAARDLDQIVRMIAEGNTSAVLPRLEQIMTLYPQSNAAIEARYWLGLTHFKLGSYRSAMNALDEYQRFAPQGEHVADCKKLLAQMADTYSKQFASLEELDAKIQAVQKEMKEKPGDVSSEMALANLYWVRGDYPKAAALYVEIVTKHPENAQDGVIKSRMEFNPNGQYTVLTPSELQRRQAQAQPLVILNTASFQSGRDSFTQKNRYYAVTGQAVNRGENALYGVELNITIYGVGNVVFDTRTVNIGRLNPGEIRAFSTRFDNFENIENVSRYECVGTFQR